MFVCLLIYLFISISGFQKEFGGLKEICSPSKDDKDRHSGMEGKAWDSTINLNAAKAVFRNA